MVDLWVHWGRDDRVLRASTSGLINMKKITIVVGVSAAIVGIAIGFFAAVASLRDVYGDTSANLVRQLTVSADYLADQDEARKSSEKIVQGLVDVANAASTVTAQGWCAMNPAQRRDARAAAARLARSISNEAKRNQAGYIARRYILEGGDKGEAGKCVPFQA